MKTLRYSNYDYSKDTDIKNKIKIVIQYVAGMSTSMFMIGVSDIPKLNSISSTGLLLSGAIMGSVFTYEFFKKLINWSNVSTKNIIYKDFEL